MNKHFIYCHIYYLTKKKKNVLPMNILPEFLVKSILAKDIDMMEKLGIYECAPEDFSLCSFVCQSKVEVSSIIENGLKIMKEEA